MSDIDLKQLRALMTALRKYETGESQSAPIKEARETVTTELVLQLITRLERAERDAAVAERDEARDTCRRWIDQRDDACARAEIRSGAYKRGPA